MPDLTDISAIISRLNEVDCHEAADMRDLVLDLALFIERQPKPAVLTEVLPTEPERKPVCVYGEPGTTVVVCDDGSKWGETRHGGHEQEMPPIPGTRRARELAVDNTPSGVVGLRSRKRCECDDDCGHWIVLSEEEYKAINADFGNRYLRLCGALHEGERIVETRRSQLGDAYSVVEDPLEETDQ